MAAVGVPRALDHSASASLSVDSPESDWEYANINDSITRLRAGQSGVAAARAAR